MILISSMSLGDIQVVSMHSGKPSGDIGTNRKFLLILSSPQAGQLQAIFSRQVVTTSI